MNNRDKIVDCYITIIEELLVAWGYIKGSSEYDKQLAITKEWLAQFEPSEIPLAILILQNIQYYDDKKVRTIIRKLSEKLSNILQDTSNTLFFPLGTSTSSSGGMHLYYYRKELHLSEDNFKLDDFKCYLHLNIDIVFFDDIIGSGKQATSFFKNNLANQQARIHYIALMGFESGIQYISDNTGFNSIIVGQRLTNQDIAFSEDSTIFGDKKNEVKQLCQKYGDKLFHNHPLGYNNTQALIVLPYTVPNNTLPIIWAGDNNEGRRSNLLWTPLFQRDKPKLQNEHTHTRSTNPVKNLKNQVVELYYNAGFELWDIRDMYITAIYIHNDYSHKICIHLVFQQNETTIRDSVDFILNQYQYKTIPSLIQFWFISDVSQVIRQLIRVYEKKYNINILIENAANLNSYKQATDKFQIHITKVLPKILEDEFLDEYTVRISKSDHFLVDRYIEQNTLKSSCSSSFYIIGLSFCGKTQLLKNIVREYINQQHSVFWHTIISNESIVQYKTFLTSLGYFLNYQYNENRLNAYISKYGCGISSELLSLISSLIKLHKPIIVVDDIHKCNINNIDLVQIFILLIQESECRLYMAGWFNIFNEVVNIQNNIKYLALNGLSHEYLDQIIQKKIGHSRIEIAKEIELKYSGLPGYAELVDQDTNLQKLYSTNSYLNSFVESLTHDEQTVLFLLGYITVPIRIIYFENQNLLQALHTLVRKKLIREEGEYYSVHDTYRLFIASYSINNDLFSAILSSAQSIIEQNYRVALDLINICLSKSKYYEAYNILIMGFDLIIHNQVYSELLKYLQQIETNITETNWDILYRKIILLERINEYQLCINYIALIGGELRNNNIVKYIHCLYVYFRCLYFTNQYDNIIKEYKNNSEVIFEFANRKILCQMLLLIGRVFYIRGDLNTSGTIYILAYQYAYGYKILEAKTIYRIGMIEYAKGLINESITTFSQLVDLDINLTPKRRSYIYNKLARSYLAIEDIEKCRYNNNESLKIKEIYHDERGLIFCKKIQAKILLYENKISEAIALLDEAKKLAIKLSLDKENLSVCLMQVAMCLKYTSMSKEKLISLLEECIHTCEEEKLLGKLRIIIELYNTYWPHLKYDIFKLCNNIEVLIQNDADSILSLYKNKFSRLSLQWVELLKSNHCVSIQMLQLSGLKIYKDDLDFKIENRSH